LSDIGLLHECHGARVLDLGEGFDRGTALSLGLERKPQVGFGSWQILPMFSAARHAMSLKTAFRAIVWAASIDSVSDRSPA
jgi:hypothetical protein